MCGQRTVVKKDLLANVLNNVAASIFWKDRHSVYLGCNDRFAREAGLQDPQEIVGRNDYQMAWTKEQADFYRECDRKVMESGEPMLNIVESQRQADGRERVILTNKVPLKDDSELVTGMLGIYMDITQRVQQEEKLERSLEENRRLTQQLMRVQEEERSHVARELHDELGQHLAAIQIGANFILEKMQASDSAVASAAADIARASRKTLQSIRDLTLRLRPPMLGFLGLEDTLRATLATWQRAHPSIDYRLDFSGELEHVPEAVGVALYRILQESLNNVVKHARATRIDISLSQKPEELELLVSDDGQGMDVEADRSGLGLQEMRERTHALGGRLELRGAPGQGLILSVSFPNAPAQAQAADRAGFWGMA
jgi:PAS domain S-box-containing protein